MGRGLSPQEGTSSVLFLLLENVFFGFFFFKQMCLCVEKHIRFKKLLQRKGDKVFVSNKIASAFGKWEEKGKQGNGKTE